MPRNSTIFLDTSELLKKVEGLKNYGKILVPAMNKTQKKLKTNLSKNIRDMYAINKNLIDPKIKTSFRTAPAEIKATIVGRRYTAARFVVGNFAAKVAGGKTPKVRIKKGSPKRPTGKSFFLLTKRKNGELGYFLTAHRETNSRYPIKVERTLSVAQMAENAQVSEKTLQETRKELFKQIEGQHKRFFGK